MDKIQILDGKRKALHRRNGAPAPARPVYFHQFFIKTHDEGENYPSVLFENLDGKVDYDYLQDCSFKFCTEDEFVEKITAEELSILLTKNEDKFEDKLPVIKLILTIAPDNELIAKLQDHGVGRWNEGVVSDWMWNHKELIKKDLNYLRDLELMLSLPKYK